jgi:signal recognition particle receptor subunit beta
MVADASILVSGTVNGVLGVWVDNQVDGQLRHFLQWPDGWWFNRSPIVDLAWSSQNQMLASASSDGKLCLWNVSKRLLLGTFDAKERTFGVAFSPDGQFLLTRTLENIRFIQCDRTQEVFSLDCPANATRGSLAVHPRSGLIAAAAAETYREESIIVWEADFECLVRNANLTKRSYRNAKVVLIGDHNSGKTSLASALSRQSLQPQTHDLVPQVYRLSRDDLFSTSGASEIREILLWEIPNHGRYESAQRLHLKNTTGTLLAFETSSGAAGLAKSAQMDESFCMSSSFRFGGPPLKKFFAATKSDRADPSDEHDIAAANAQQSTVVPLFVTSANNGSMICGQLSARQSIGAHHHASMSWRRSRISTTL